VPLCLSSFANCGSTKDTRRVDLFALSLGTEAPQFAHWTRVLLPLFPFDLPRLFRFTGIILTSFFSNVPFIDLTVLYI
jgi:hypothetical protein